MFYCLVGVYQKWLTYGLAKQRPNQFYNHYPKESQTSSKHKIVGKIQTSNLHNDSFVH